MTSVATGFKYFSKRNLVGAALFLLFVGEGTVALYNGLFTPPGLIVLSGLYLTLFWFYEAMVTRFNLTYTRLVPLTFAVYSVLITGLLHGELANYAKGEGVITTLIRIQCSLFPIFAYAVLNRYWPRQGGGPSVTKASLLLVGFFLLLTPTKQFGFINLVETIQKVPAISLIFVVLGLLAFILAIRPTRPGKTYDSKSFRVATWALFGLACIPHLAALLALLIAMPLVTLWFWRQPDFRRTKA